MFYSGSMTTRYPHCGKYIDRTDISKSLICNDTNRYVLKDRETGAVFFHVTFTMVKVKEEDDSKPDTKETKTSEPNEDDLD
jgi:hypothetical protein